MAGPIMELLTTSNLYCIYSFRLSEGVGGLGGWVTIHVMVCATVTTGVCFWVTSHLSVSHTLSKTTLLATPSSACQLIFTVLLRGSSKFVRYKILYTSSNFREDEKMEM